jgi:hypothetical protein
MYSLIERFVAENPGELGPMFDSLKKGSQLKYKEYIRETLSENLRKGNYIRMYPARNSDIYDVYFQGQRPYNKVIYKVLFTDEVMKNYVAGKPGTDMKLSYKMDMPPTTYE